MTISHDNSSTELCLGVVLYQNSGEELARLSASLQACQTEPQSPSFYLRWLDNSPAPTLETFFSGLLPPNSYQFAGKNLGFAKAHNHMMKAAFADGANYYICVNPDAVLHPRCLKEMVAEARRLPNTGLVEARLFPQEHPKHYDPDSHLTPWCSGCVLLLTRSAYEAVGGFDENFFMYCEDVDLSWRMRAKNFATLLAPSALAFHHSEDREDEGQRIQMVLRSGAYLARKYQNSVFYDYCTAEYRRRCGKEVELSATGKTTHAERARADFSHAFYFAQNRW